MENQSWSQKLRDILGAPFKWIRDLYREVKTWVIVPPADKTSIIGRIRNTIHRHPFLSLTALFLATLGITFITGIWWLGGSIFLLSMVLFTSNSLFTGFLRTGTIAFEMLLAGIMFFMITAMVAPVAEMWLLYLLAPATLILFKSVHAMMGYSVMMKEAANMDFEMGEEVKEVSIA